MHEELTTEKGKWALPSSLRRKPAPESSMAHFNNSVFKLLRRQHFRALSHKSFASALITGSLTSIPTQIQSAGSFPPRDI